MTTFEVALPVGGLLMDRKSRIHSQKDLVKFIEANLERRIRWSTCISNALLKSMKIAWIGTFSAMRSVFSFSL